MIINIKDLLLWPTTSADAAALLSLYRDVAATPNSGLASTVRGYITAAWVLRRAQRPARPLDLRFRQSAPSRRNPRDPHAPAPVLPPADRSHRRGASARAGHGVGSRLFKALLEAAGRLDPPVARVRLPDGRIEDGFTMTRIAAPARGSRQASLGLQALHGLRAPSTPDAPVAKK